jgi:hypothetical protein
LIIIFISACGSKKDDTVVAASKVSISTLQLRADADSGDEQVTLDWQMLAGAASYNIYYIENTTQPGSAVMKTSGTPIIGLIGPRHTISLANGSTYWFAFSAVIGGVESDLSVIIPATPTKNYPPQAPKNVRVKAGVRQVTVTWSPVTDPDHYLLYCYWMEGLNVGEGTIEIPGQASHLQIVDSTTINWTIGEDVGTTNGLKNTRTYYFWIYALTGDVSSSSSFVA